MPTESQVFERLGREYSARLDEAAKYDEAVLLSVRLLRALKAGEVSLDDVEVDNTGWHVNPKEG